MAYNGKTNWQLNEIVKPKDMNRIEQGIIDAHESLLTHNKSADAHKNRFDEFVKGVTGSNATLTITKGNGTTSTITVNNVANATNATKATQDSAGQQINSTYIKGLSVSGKTITYTKGNGSTGTITTQDTVYTHPNSGVKAGTYRSVTVNAQGHVTAGSNPTTLSGYGITDAPTKTGGGASGTWGINITGNAASATMAKVISGFANIDNGTWGHSTGTYITGFQEKGGGSIQWRAEDGRLYERVDGTFWQREGTYEVIDTSTVNNYAPTKTGGGASGTWGINISGNANNATKWNGMINDLTTENNTDTWIPVLKDNKLQHTTKANMTVGNADKVDGYHENSFLRYRGAAAAAGEDTLWSQIGIKEYDGILPKGVSGTYNYGAVVSLPGGSARLDIWYNHRCSANRDGLWYRSGWSSDQKPWARLLDSNNYTNFVPTKTGTGASGTWGINISGKANTAGTADTSKACSGNSATATKATQDSAGQQINTTYIKGLSASNATLTYTKGNGTTGMVTVNNVANADKLDGYHYSDIVTKIQGKTTPTMTALVDWAAMTTACNLSPATVSVSTVVDGSSVTLSVPSIKNLRNIGTGIMAYGGDNSSGSLTGTNRPFYTGDIILKQSYKNFDKILIVFCNDDSNVIGHKIWEKWELEYAFNHSWRFVLFEASGMFWWLRGTKKQGTNTTQRLSTDTFWRANEQNSSIVEIYGLKY